MNPIHEQGEVRPNETPWVPATPGIPAFRLRSGRGDPIRPEDCKVPDCPICEWRRDGLIPGIPTDR